MGVRFRAFEVVVDDMPAACAFYRLLGLEIPDGAEAQSNVDVWLVPGVQMLCLEDSREYRELYPYWTPPVGDGRVTLGFLCDSPAEVDATWHRLTTAGHRSRVEPWDATWGMRYAGVFDPAGTAVDLFAPTAASARKPLSPGASTQNR